MSKLLVREHRRRLRLTLLLAAATAFILLGFRLAGSGVADTLLGLTSLEWTARSFIGPDGELASFAPPIATQPGSGLPSHTELRSVSTHDRAFFRIVLGSERGAFNPNVIPHPGYPPNASSSSSSSNATFLVVARRAGAGSVQAGGLGLPSPSVQLVCSARFVAGGALACVDAASGAPAEPAVLPIATTRTTDPARCPEEMAFFVLNSGPHDARLFYGPRSPLVVYGSNSGFTCFGQWIQDLRGLVPGLGSGSSGSSSSIDEEPSSSSSSPDDTTSTAAAAAPFPFRDGTELQRPPPYAAIEKNWFLFWDAAGAAHVHFDLAPRRAFARLHADGSVGPDLAAGGAGADADADAACLARHLPAVPWAGGARDESVHQATNSLAVTLCRRADAACTPGAGNTFVLAVFQHKTFFGFHAAYRPYAVLFRQQAPFALWAVSTRPLWVAGQARRPSGEPEMLYVTSMSWRASGQTYHGYADDVLFLAFGIEDRDTAGIDVLAGDLLANLGLC